MKNKWFIVTFLLVAIVLATTLTVAAADSTGIVQADCNKVRFQFTVAPGEMVKLELRLYDSDWSSPMIQHWANTFGPGTYDKNWPWVDNPEGRNYWVFMFSSTDGGTSWKPFAGEEGFMVCPEGCTPGYWRNHLEDWPPTGYSPTDDFDTTFGVDYFDPDLTLGDTINLGGGGVRKIARHGTAALLSSLHPDVYNYPYTAAQVIAIVQGTSTLYDIDDLAYANELGCQIP